MTKDPERIRRRAAEARERLRACDLCPRTCGNDRLAGQLGTCRIGAEAVVAGAHPHFGEEPPLVGRHGSGAIFFTGCNLHCVFCQNFDISHTRDGHSMTAEQLASVMLALQDAGCHNVNLVTPSHVVPQILAAFAVAVERGFDRPIVYNSSGYDALSTLWLLEGLVDIYMPDFKMWDPHQAKLYLSAEDYPAVARDAVREMHRQVGDLEVNGEGIAVRGLLVRHMVMPNGVAGSSEIFRFLADRVCPDTYVNVMDQYRPAGYAHRFEPIERSLTRSEYSAAVDAAGQAGLRRLDPGSHRVWRVLRSP
ncbi:MAG: 4Fe-4S cluster-binding domain-containing protein [Candidatus Eisenbacteria bacterium]|nr:4Fe-4S cluster-binding domain-containing protein [Candidatus Eisenbacteria bacterium]